MSFRRCVESTAELQNAYCAGLQALRRADRNRIDPSDPRNLAGSIDLDAALRRNQPNASRWDYGIGWRQGPGKQEKVFWVEVHPARSEANVAEVEAKVAWLKGWLTRNGRSFESLGKHFRWIASGETFFTKSSPQLRRLASSGVTLVGRRLPLR